MTSTGYPWYRLRVANTNVIRDIDTPIPISTCIEILYPLCDEMVGTNDSVNNVVTTMKYIIISIYRIFQYTANGYDILYLYTIYKIKT